MHVEKTPAANLRDGLILSSTFLSQGNQHTASGVMRRIEIEIGEVVSFAVGIYTIQNFWTLTRKPEGSSATLRDARLTGVDTPGVYTIECETDGLWSRTLELCAFSKQQMFGNVPKRADLRLQCRSWINEPGRKLEEVISRLEK